MSDMNDDVIAFANKLGEYIRQLDEYRREYDRARMACEEERKRLQGLCEQYNRKVFDSMPTKRESVALQILNGVASRGSPDDTDSTFMLREIFKLADLFLAISGEKEGCDGT